MAPEKQLIPLLDHAMDDQRKPGVTSRALYAFLGLNPTVYARWTQKNIVKNPYAIEHDDWEHSLLDVENPIPSGSRGRPTQDFVLSMDFAKRLAMMARSAKGEEARQYFLACERATQEQPRLPQLHNPMNQVMIETVVRVDTLEYETAELKKENARLTANLAHVETKADLALEDAHRMTLEEFILKNGLLRQFPRSHFATYVHWLKQFCLENALYVPKVPVYGQSWPDENSYPLAALAAWLRHESRKPQQVRLLQPRSE